MRRGLTKGSPEVVMGGTGTFKGFPREGSGLEERTEDNISDRGNRQNYRKGTNIGRGTNKIRAVVVRGAAFEAQDLS